MRKKANILKCIYKNTIRSTTILPRNLGKRINYENRQYGEKYIETVDKRE